ncbi:kinase-like domain-containing protein [Glomus cerebriforme]|uniref:Kinase-like domain-containing protein n=1 Tax=Glomus cerebriforme TaxID=658196 RepID=A0A397SVD3_9GLOM|nr:kinase-like domain-containing protein [Glomus cerebriforme]
MSNIRNELVNVAIQKAHETIDYDVYHNIDEHYEILQQTILAHESLTNDEKSEAIKILNKNYDVDKVLNDVGKKRVCENCQEECLALLYCEFCIKNYLKANFSNWTSGNNDIDDLIHKCQMESLAPYKIVEWIPYSNLQNINYLTKGEFSEIYTADWIGGQYYEWNSEQQQLERYGKISPNYNQQMWCYSTMLWSNSRSIKWKLYVVMRKLDINLRKYLQQNHNQITWKERIKITFDIIEALDRIHNENAIHRDLHSGNILYLQFVNNWYISDFGFCGPADKPLGKLMERCWNANPEERPDIVTLLNEIVKINKSYYEQQTNDSTNLNYIQSNKINTSPINLSNFNSEICDFKDLLEPRNATKDTVSENKSEQYNLQESVEYNKEKNKCKRIYSNISDENENKDIIDTSKKMKVNINEVGYQYTRGNFHITSNDENEVYNDPNLHSEDQNELEIPEDEI